MNREVATRAYGDGSPCAATLLARLADRRVGGHLPLLVCAGAFKVFTVSTGVMARGRDARGSRVFAHGRSRKETLRSPPFGRSCFTATSLVVRSPFPSSADPGGLATMRRFGAYSARGTGIARLMRVDFGSSTFDVLSLVCT